MKLKSHEDDEELMFCAMVFFTLEWKYSIEFAYLVAEHMEKAKIDEIDFYTLWALALPLRFDSRMGIELSGDNRLVKERQTLVCDFIKQGEADSVIKKQREKYVEIVGLTVLFNTMTCVDGGSYRDWFKNNTNLRDWASFMEGYRMFDIWHEKKWSNKKITNMRKILEMLSPVRGNLKNPDFRA